MLCLVYLRFNLMTDYWPKRVAPEGFSIEKLAKSYRAKLSNVTSFKKKISQEDSTEKVVSLDIANDPQGSLDNLKGFDGGLIHWANRDFIEYSDIA